MAHQVDDGEARAGDAGRPGSAGAGEPDDGALSPDRPRGLRGAGGAGTGRVRVEDVRLSLPGFRIPLRFLRGQYGRTTLTVLAVALGVALVCALDLVTRSMQLAFDEIIDTMAGRTALEVSAGADGLVPEEVAAVIARVPGVELAVPVVRATAFATDGSGETLTVHGVDILNEDALRT